MEKIPTISIHNAKDIPDHLLQEVQDVAAEMGKSFEKLFQSHDLNIILSAFSFVHAALVVSIVDEQCLEEAASTGAIGLIKNIEHMSGQKILTEGGK